ncbi:AvrD family protein [Kitasatospora arboriphila]|uniref:AvrD family protein n=1 Tax=Kitasatospora arboriphila TaxID=258052 RepID=A0ABN1TGF0_9ACTN
MATDQQLLLHSIDDYLGPGETRFFSRGYQRAGYRVHGLHVTPAGPAGSASATSTASGAEPGVRGTLDLRYPADWSRKKDGTDLRPHLSTVDALVLGVQLAELHLAHAYGLGEAERRTVRLAKVVLRAGTAPQEDLTGVPLSARLRSTEPAGARYRSVHECAVGNLRVRVETEHPIVERAAEEARFGSLDAALGRGEYRFYGAGFKYRHHEITDVAVDNREHGATALVRFTRRAGAPAPVDGIAAGDRPTVSLIDCFVVNLQLAQVLMYELDGLSRADSNTLWMMQTVLTAPEEEPAVELVEGRPFTTRAALTGRRLLPLRGGTWRNVELSGGLAGIGMRCSFAHELPAHIAATAR